MEIIPIIEEAKTIFRDIVSKHDLAGEKVRVTIGTLTPQQAIGTPGRPDFALLQGKEVMIEAQFRESFGQAFTSQPQTFDGMVIDVLNLSLESSDSRAIFIATLNAMTAHLGLVTGVRHCRNEEPEMCGTELAQQILESFGRIRIGLVGYQPAILDHLVRQFGADNVVCSDLDVRNIGSTRFGTRIRDGKTENADIVRWCDLLLVTSSTVVNNTFDGLRSAVAANGKHLIMFGVTGAGISALLGLERICLRAH